ncbi:nicotinate phosphoribosyltransferase [Gordonia sp. PP30]|uniref:nicotinate phosphoribosyltransferase n=1 Tax=unclassified Gordonia (in: high G+C Gram-positive bacteria) TaxID=2657482 RepID=UPI001FFEE3C3|nr:MULTISPECIES: nicotinate phosphoribosyltransferase [unclassified Gordonia (in: high G+C Gram-positive bacteria)]UQE76386.1 nicotinate phosphoribosyltransferase [Gordonia sp. PP30]
MSYRVANVTSTALLTDQYELTMISAALAAGTADRRCVFEVFARRLPDGRRYGVVAGTGRLLDELADFRFTDDELRALTGIVDEATLDWLAGYRFSGEIDGYAEGELYFPGSPVLTVRGGFAEAVILETLVLSILNHDSAIASAAARMVSAAAGRPIIEMGSRRTHERAAVAAARAAYLAGLTATSNLEAARTYGVPSAGTAAHAWTLSFAGSGGERAAFAAQIARLGTGTTLLVDTYDITTGVRNAIEVAGPELNAVRIDSGDLGMLARQVRQQLDDLGATRTKIVVSGDLDEYAIASLRAEPVDIYGVGTSLVTGSGAPTAGMVYKLVEVDGIPVSKRASHKESRGGAKRAVRTARDTGTVVEEILYRDGTALPPDAAGTLNVRELQIPLVRGGDRVDGLPTLTDARTHLARGLVSLPWEGLGLSHGEPAIGTRFADTPTPETP